MKHTASPKPCVVDAPCLPGGRRVGRYMIEGDQVIWTRSVSVIPHLVRVRNAWSVNRPILDQLRADAVDVVRYVDAGAGVTYEVDLDYFETHAEVLRDFVAPGEDAFVLARGRWRRHEKADASQLSLFPECCST